MPDRTTPYGAFNFLVEIDGIDGPIGGFSDVSGLSTEITVAEYRNGNDAENHVRKVPNIWKSADVTLKRGLVNCQDIWTWINDVRVNGINAQRQAVITLRDEAGQPVQAWTLHNTIPLKWTGPTLAAKGGGDVAMEELVLSTEMLTLNE